MAPDRLPAPWHAFLSDVDAAATEPLVLHCLGGFAVSLHYGLTRPTGDIDVVEVIPSAAKAWLATTAGPGSALHRQHQVYLQIVTIATVPYAYEDRLIRVARETFTHLRLFVLDPYDLALSKLTRNLEVDVEDVKHLARVTTFDLAVLQDRYREELRPYVSGPVERSDLTLQLWVDAIREERGQGA